MVTREFKSRLQHKEGIMKKLTDYEKLVLHISRELHSRLLSASEKEKLSVGSLLRKAIHEYLDKNGNQK
jgi:predicted HicB family RNase H-like nuclease